MLEIELADRKVVSYLIKRFGIHAKHKLGQNFLVRPDVVRAIAEASEIGEGSRVLEIGPGIGTLTQALARTGAEVTAVEIDQSLGRILSHTLEPYKNVHIIYDDVLKLDLNKLMGDKEWHVAANLPYYITTPILLDLVQSDLPISTFVFMMQKEVAERIMASPGTKAYGALTLAVQFYCTSEVVMDVPPSSFIPRPAVNSTVLKRRKVFTNAMKAGGISAEQGKEILAACGIDGKRRGETFSMEEFASLADAWYDLIHKDKE